MKILRKLGSTSQILQIFIADSSSTTGAGLTGLAFNTASLTAYFHRDTDTTATAISLVTMTVGTFTSSGFKEIDATNMPGWYQFCPPNTAFASGASSVGLHLKGATNMAPLPIEVDLDGQVDVTSWNGTAVSAPATAGIPDVNVKNIDNDAASASGTVTFPNATLASTTNISAGTITTVTNLTNAPTAGDFTATMKTSIGTAVAASAVASVTGNVGGNVTGSVGSVVGAVGSVTGAVGSVTGNVGGNVTGTVGSVVGAVGSVTGAVGSVTGNVGGNVVGSVASVTAAVTVSGTSALTESYAAQGAGLTLAQALYGMNQFLSEHATGGGTTWTVKKRDRVTTAKTYTLDSATTPTSLTEAS